MTPAAKITAAALTGLFVSASGAAAEMKSTKADNCVRERVREVLAETHFLAESQSNRNLNITLELGYTFEQLENDFVAPCEEETGTESNFFSNVDKLEFTLGRAKMTFE